MKHRIAALIGLAAADLALTLYGFTLGLSEAMPAGAYLWATQGVAGLLALKTISVAGTLAILRIARPEWRTYAWAFALFLMTLPVGWNIAQIVIVTYA